MSYEQASSGKRPHATANSASIPSAPPLPSSRPFQKARIAAKGLFGYPSRPQSPQSDLTDGERFIRSSVSPRKASLGITEDASASHKTGLEINTLAINERGTHALLGGKEIFKTVRIEESDEGPKCVEELNLKTAIKSNPKQASGQPRQVYSIDIADVAWAKGDCGDFVAAATSSGKIILYDLGHAGLPAAQLYEHSRQVHRITFNPHRGNLLLSGSQDGSVRLWDLRDIKREAANLQSKRKYSGQSDGVRDVKWSPTDGVDFAFSTDGGWVQRWDIRNLRTAKVKIPAHPQACNSVDWHPDGKHLASASVDRTVKVWDISNASTRKATWEIRTPQAVFNARFRSACESYMPGDDGARLCTQIVTSYSREYPAIHLWDFRRSYLPFRSIVPYATAPTDLLWHSQDLLWTVGREGAFAQIDIQHTRKTIDRRNLQSISLSCKDELASVCQTRRRMKAGPRKEKVNSVSELERINKTLSLSPESSSLSRSLGDDSLDHSFLRSMSHLRRKSSTNSKTPSVGSAATPTIKLDDVLMNRKSFRPQQAAFRGHVTMDLKGLKFEYLAANYTAVVNGKKPTGLEASTGVISALDANAEHASRVGLYRSSQTWKIISFVIASHLHERAEKSSKRRRQVKHVDLHHSYVPLVQALTKQVLARQARSATEALNLAKPVSNLTQQLQAPEGSSNNPTPLARPSVSGLPVLPDPNLGGEKFVLPPSITGQQHDNETHAVDRPGTGRQLTSSNLNLHKLASPSGGTNRVDMIHKWNSEHKSVSTPQAIGFSRHRPIPQLEKHDSDESFRFLEESTDSRGPSFPASIESGGSGGVNMVSERPSRKTGPAITLNDVSMSDGQLDDFERQPLPQPSPGVLREAYLSQASSGPERSRLDGQTPQQQQSGYFGDAETVKTVPDRPARLRNLLEKQVDRSNQEHLMYEAESEDDTDRPFVLIEMLLELTKYHTRQLPDPQMLAHMLLLIEPTLPANHQMPKDVLEAMIEHYIEVFSSLGYVNADLPALFERLYGHSVRAGLNPLLVEAVLATYHQQLLQGDLLNEAAMLRKVAFPRFPEVYQDFTKDNFVHMRCGDCGKAILVGSSRSRCEECGVKMKECGICWSFSSPYELGGKTEEEQRSTSSEKVSQGPELLSMCLLCGHGGHAACLQMWFVEMNAYSEGTCPTEGCLCDCVRGTWRQEKKRLVREQQKTHHKQKGARFQADVKVDEWKVKESRAVKRAGATLARRDGSKAENTVVPA